MGCAGAIAVDRERRAPRGLHHARGAVQAGRLGAPATSVKRGPPAAEPETQPHNSPLLPTSVLGRPHGLPHTLAAEWQVIPAVTRNTEIPMSPSYYRLLYKLDGRNAFLIWFSNDCDGIVAQDGRMLSFSNDDLLRQFAAQARLVLADETPMPHDLDSVQAWLLCPRRDTIDCSATLSAWNLFGDIARSLPTAGAAFSALDRAHDCIYEKLFFGNNLPAVTPESEHYEPSWSDDEVAALATILDHGLRLLRLVRREVAA